MAEKKGYTIKLQYDFNTARCCEIEFVSGKFCRVTANEFRSFGGRRRILNVDDSKNTYYEEYFGNVYYYGTNKVVPQDQIVSKTNFINGQDTRVSLPRPHEMKW